MYNEQTKQTQLDFFSGSLTALGLQSNFAALRQEGAALILLKGTIGCGKSEVLAQLVNKHTNHAHLAPAAVQVIERHHSPYEPERIAGVVIGNSIAILDANDAHALCPYAPALREHVVDFYEGLQPKAVQAHAEKIPALLGQISCLETRVARYVASMAGLLFDTRRAATCATSFEKIERYAKYLAQRTMPPVAKEGAEQRRFITAITQEGNACYHETITALASDIYVVHDEYGAASKALLCALRGEALARGYNVISCPCALLPEEGPEHLFIPALGLGFVTSNQWHKMAFANQHNIHCARFTDANALKACRSRLRFHTKAAKELQAQCGGLLAQLAEARAELRACYRPAMRQAFYAEKVVRVNALCGIK